MANRALTARNKAQAIWPGATVHSRGRKWIKHQHPTVSGRLMLDTSVGPIHYGPGEDQEIDTAWQPTTGAWDYEMTHANFQVYARDTLNAGDIFRFEMGGHWVEFDPQSLSWVDETYSQDQIAVTQAVTAQVTDDVIRFPDGFGTGRHFQYYAQAARLQKLLVIDDAAYLPTPAGYLTGAIHLQLEFTLSASADVDFYLDGVLWEKQNGIRVKTADYIEVRDAATGTEVYFRVIQPRVHDQSGGGGIVGEMEVRRQGGVNNLYICVRVPKTWLDSAVYPVRIDPSIDESVTGGEYDAHEAVRDAEYDGTGIYLICFAHTDAGYNYMAEAIFTGVALLGTDIVSSAYFEGYVPYDIWDDFYGAFHGEAADSAVDFVTNADVANRDLTSAASTEFDEPSWGEEAYFGSAYDIANVIQEIIDRPGWSSGNDMGIIFLGSTDIIDSGRFSTYEGDSSNPCNLHIEYDGAAVGNPWYAYAQQ